MSMSYSRLTTNLLMTYYSLQKSITCSYLVGLQLLARHLVIHPEMLIMLTIHKMHKIQ